MAKWITYEWALEYVNKWDDIVDTDHNNTLPRLWRDWKGFEADESTPEGEPVQARLCLVRISAHAEGKDYAYVSEGRLATEFEETEKPVPQRYLKEFENYNRMLVA